MQSRHEVVSVLNQCAPEQTILLVHTQDLQLEGDNRAIYIHHDEASVTLATRMKDPITLALSHINFIEIIGGTCTVSLPLQ